MLFMRVSFVQWVKVDLFFVFDPLYLRVDAPQRRLLAPYTHFGLPGEG